MKNGNLKEKYEFYKTQKKMSSKEQILIINPI
jgi:hypothetical protein